MKPLVLDTYGEASQDLCPAAFLESAYNWRTGGFNLWRCQKKRGHKGAHESYIGIPDIVDHDWKGSTFVRFQWTAIKREDRWCDMSDFWNGVDKERAR